MNNNNNNKNKSQRGAQKAAAQVASLANEVKQLRQQAKKAGGNARPSRVRNRRQKGGAGNFGRNGNDVGLNKQTQWAIIEKDELISAVNGSVALAATKYAINPGLAATFPVGAPEAKRWTEWKADYCEFYFQRTVSEFATQGQVGRVVLAIDYSALNDAPATLQAAELLHSAKGMPCTPRIALRADCAILNKADPKYIRTMGVPADADIRLFDGGNLWFVTSGCTNGTEIGELRVMYKFLVRLPNLDDTYVKASGSVSIFQGTGEAGGATTVAAQLLFATATYNGAEVVNTAGSFVPSAGSWRVSVAVDFIFTSSSNTDVRLGMFKNGGGGSAWNPRLTYVTAINTYVMLQLDEIVFSDGDDAFTFTVTSTYTAGSVTENCRIIWEKV